MASVADKIRTFEPKGGDWRPLDNLFAACFAARPAPQDIDAIFSLFERYPEEDGAEVFWSAIHGLESGGGYEERLRSSLRSAPSWSALVLAIRIVNSGDPSFLPLIADVASRGDIHASVRSDAAHYVAKKRKGF